MSEIEPLAPCPCKKVYSQWSPIMTKEHWKVVAEADLPNPIKQWLFDSLKAVKDCATRQERSGLRVEDEKVKIAKELHYYFDNYMPNPSHKVWENLKDNQQKFWLDRAEQLMSAGVSSTFTAPQGLKPLSEVGNSTHLCHVHQQPYKPEGKPSIHCPYCITDKYINKLCAKFAVPNEGLNEEIK